MTPPLPLDAPEIFVEWVTVEGGIGVTAFTDDKGRPFIGLYPLNRMGSPNGLPILFRRRRLMTDVAIGFRGREPLVIFIDVEVSERGLSLIVCIPATDTLRYERHTFARWGSDRPRYGFLACPVNSNWPVLPFPEVPK
jgi:hypothetical protein